MEPTNTYYKDKLCIPTGTLIIEGPLHPQQLSQLSLHEDLQSFRPAPGQHQALIEIAGLPEGRIIIARENETIIGYVTFLYPDPLERWSEGEIENMIELGAVEVIPLYRGTGVGKKLLAVSMMDDAMEDYIIITTEYYWHWDLKRTGLNVWEYRKMMENMMNTGGLKWYATDDPEICSHPANCLMVRIGNRVKPKDIQKFDSIRFMNRFMY